MNAMKTALLVGCFLWTTVALGQSIGGAITAPSMTQPYQMTYHAEHASAQPMAQEQSLLAGSGTVTIGHGELPLWEVAPKEPPAVPLGDTARLLRKQHETAKKAQFVFEN
jgi:hypothetical protein